MRYYKQTRDACFAYSLLQLGRVSKRAVKEYEARLVVTGYQPNYGNISGWLKKYAPEVEEQWSKILGFPIPTNGIPVPDDSGILIVKGDGPFTRVFHAVSYDHGLVLDPAEDAPGKAETIQSLQERYRIMDGLDVMPVGAFSIKG